jgi:branched-chain amino acid transport system ATP-binding protein
VIGMLECINLVSGYGGIEVLHGVDLSVEVGSVTAVIGPNGSGKSTLLKTIFGLIKPWRGRVTLDGYDITGVEPHRLLGKGISYIPQRHSVFPLLTVEENLRMGLWIHRDDEEKIRDALERTYAVFPMLKEKARLRAGSLSGGELRLLELARAIMVRPRMLLIDEFSVGLSPILLRETYRLVNQLREQEGITILAVDQNVRQILSISDYVYVMKLGRKVQEGPASEVMSRLEEIMKDWLAT